MHQRKVSALEDIVIEGVDEIEELDRESDTEPNDSVE